MTLGCPAGGEGNRPAPPANALEGRIGSRRHLAEAGDGRVGPSPVFRRIVTLPLTVASGVHGRA
jgi:hypothetical protein